MNREHFHDSIIVVKKVNNLWNVSQQCGSKAWQVLQYFYILSHVYTTLIEWVFVCKLVISKLLLNVAYDGQPK